MIYVYIYILYTEIKTDVCPCLCVLRGTLSNVEWSWICTLSSNVLPLVSGTVTRVSNQAAWRQHTEAPTSSIISSPCSFATQAHVFRTWSSDKVAGFLHHLWLHICRVFQVWCNTLYRGLMSWFWTMSIQQSSQRKQQNQSLKIWCPACAVIA